MMISSSFRVSRDLFHALEYYTGLNNNCHSCSTRACSHGLWSSHWLLGTATRYNAISPPPFSFTHRSFLPEWKIDMDSPTDTHRHLSHLIGLYPGYALTRYDPSFQPVKNLSQPGLYLNYTHEDVVNASEISLIHRGNGTGPDADAGWEKVWRAAAWAQLGNATEFYHELSVGAPFLHLLSFKDVLFYLEIFNIDLLISMRLNVTLPATYSASTTLWTRTRSTSSSRLMQTLGTPQRFWYALPLLFIHLVG
jgi:hypothetical protein